MAFKKIIFINLCCMFYAFQANAFQDELRDTEKYKQFGLIWGFLKYHDPQISKGEYDWNTVFIENITKIDTIKNQEKLNIFLSRFISKYTTKEEIVPFEENQKFFKKNIDYHWIEDLPFSNQIKSKLTPLKYNANIGDYYVSMPRLTKIPSFKNESGLPDFNYSIKSNRLLTFFSFWNVIQYYNVNKFLNDIPWYDQLDSHIPNFINADTKLKYEKSKSKLIASLNDSHSFYISKIVSDSLFKYMPPFGVKLVDDTLVVNYIRNKGLAMKDDIKLGDLIVEVDDLDIPAIIDKKVGSIISHSNKSFLKKWSTWVFYNTQDSIKIKVKRKDEIVTRYIKLYEDIETQGYSYLKSKHVYSKKEQLINNNIGYINLESISKRELKKAFKKFSKTKGIIIDLRNYPKNISERIIAKFLYPQKKQFLKVLFPVEGKPSYAKFDKAPLSFIKNPFVLGSRNRHYYKGKVVLLVNHFTQSKAEFIGMAIQASPNCITVGEQTAGSVMNITTYKLPDDTPINFTSLSAFYPNGNVAQGKGLEIDYFIRETTANFLDNPFMEKAIELINKD